MSTTFINWILDGFWAISDWFYDAYQVADDWGWPWSLISAVFFHLYDAFRDMAINFAYFGFWIMDISDKIRTIITFDNVYAYLKSYLDAGMAAWEWVESSWLNVWDIIDRWWEVNGIAFLDMLEAVRDWTTEQLGYLEGALNELEARLDNLNLEFPDITGLLSWFTDWWGNILLNLDTWWQDRLEDIQGLIDSAFIVRESYWQGWQELSGPVVEFFADPLEWLWARFTDWFLGPEE